MATLKKFNLQGDEVGKVELDDSFANSEANGQLVKDYIVALRANARQWSANTKGRSEVNHTKKKPHRQKGTGRARQGSLAAPQFKGGGIVFGPKPKFDQHVRINRKERRAAIRSLIAELARNGELMVMEDPKMDQPSTKQVASMLKKTESGPRTLFLTENATESVGAGEESCSVSVRSTQYDAFAKSVRNLPKTAYKSAMGISGIDVAVARRIFVTEAGLKQIIDWLGTPKTADAKGA